MNRRAFLGAGVALVQCSPPPVQAQPEGSDVLPDWLPTPWPVDYRTVLSGAVVERFYSAKAQGMFAGVPVEEILTDMAWFEVDAPAREAYRQALFSKREHVAEIYAAYQATRIKLLGQSRSTRARHWEATVELWREAGLTVRTWNDLAVAQGLGKYPEAIGQQQAWIQHHGFYLADVIPQELLARGRRNRMQSLRRAARKAGAQ